MRFSIEDVNVGNRKYEIAGNQWLVLESVPYEFTLRYGILPRILVRQCYKDIYDLVTSQMLDENYINPAFLFTGVPGIGKSIFLVYFLCRYILDDRFSDKRFALEFDRGVYDYFTPTAVKDEYESMECRKKEFPIMEVLVLSDIAQVTEPDTRGKWLLVFSSPNPLRYSQLMKRLPRFYYVLPAWSYDELISFNQNEESWFPIYEICGGIVRDIFSYPNSSDSTIAVLEKKIKDSGSTVIDNYMNRYFGVIDIETSYELVHINPPRSEDGKYQYRCINYEYSFASMYVFRKLMSKFKMSRLREVAFWFNYRVDLAEQKFGGSFARDIFEMLCLFCMPLSGCVILCETLEGSQQPLHRFVLP